MQKRMENDWWFHPEGALKDLAKDISVFRLSEGENGHVNTLVVNSLNSDLFDYKEAIEGICALFALELSGSFETHRCEIVKKQI